MYTIEKIEDKTPTSSISKDSANKPPPDPKFVDMSCTTTFEMAMQLVSLVKNESVIDEVVAINSWVAVRFLQKKIIFPGAAQVLASACNCSTYSLLDGPPPTQFHGGTWAVERCS